MNDTTTEPEPETPEEPAEPDTEQPDERDEGGTPDLEEPLGDPADQV